MRARDGRAQSRAAHGVLRDGQALRGGRGCVATAQVRGNVVYVKRGGCNFTQKARMAQAAGAVAMVTLRAPGRVALAAPRSRGLDGEGQAASARRRATPLGRCVHRAGRRAAA